MRFTSLRLSVACTIACHGATTGLSGTADLLVTSAASCIREFGGGWVLTRPSAAGPCAYRPSGLRRCPALQKLICTRRKLIGMAATQERERHSGRQRSWERSAT